MKPRFFLMIGAVFLLFIIAIALGASSGARKDPSGVFPGKVYTVTVTGDIGVESIRVINHNTNGKATILSTALPFSFNCTSGDTVSFNVTAKIGFKFDSWYVNDGTFHDQNPYTLKVTGPFVMRAGFIPTEGLS